MLDQIKELTRRVFKTWPWWALGLVALGVIGAVGVLTMQIGGAANVGLLSILLKLCLIPFAIAVLFIALRVADRLAGIEWQQLRERVLSTPATAAAYACTRWLAVAIIIAAVML